MNRQAAPGLAGLSARSPRWRAADVAVVAVVSFAGLLVAALIAATAPARRPAGAAGPDQATRETATSTPAVPG